MAFALAESVAYCKSLARRTAGNFYYSFLTLPAREHADMCVLYAFMRHSDDLGDDASKPAAERAVLLDAWHTSLTRALDEQQFEHPIFPALAELVDRRRIPREYLFAVIEGVRIDLAPARFETFSELNHYCYHVAGAVGLCCIHVWGFHDERAIEPAIDCGTAFQLTNILRDLGEDARVGRIYLPREDLRRFGYTPTDLAAGCRDDRFRALMQFETERARDYYRQADRLFDYLDPPGKPVLAAMLRIYGGLLDRIERRPDDVFTRRIRLPAWRKLWISLDTMLRGARCGR
jgi:phytoene synthase